MKNKKIKMLLLAIVLCISCFLTCFATTIQVAYASSIGVVGGYTNVLEDLQKDDTFNAEDYPVIQDDYSLQVIQVAESSEKDLFIYVYQPCSPNDDLRATSINISTTTGNASSYNNYSLILLNKQGCFGKYKVKNFVLSNENVRTYDISSIFRKWNEKYDKGSGNDNTINEVSFAVAQKFTAKTMEDGTIEYANNGIDVVYITEKYCGFVRYSGGFELFGWADACDSWFVAFNTDRDIDKLLEADVYYVQQGWMHGLLAYPAGVVGGTPIYTYDYVDYLTPEITDENINDCSVVAELNYKQKGEFEGKGWWASKYTWDRISTTENFIATEDRENIFELGVINIKQETKLTDATLSNLKNTKWVLRFAETAFEEEGTTEAHWYNQTIISNVSILRLKFETDGVVYNLGAIDNKQSSDLIPDNEYSYSIEIADWFKIILSVLLLIVLLVVLAPILPTIFNVLWAVLKYIFKALWWLITTPFKLIGKVFKKRE